MNYQFFLPIEEVSFSEYLKNVDIRIESAAEFSYDNGSLRTTMRDSGIGQFRQRFDFRQFPFDKQTLKIKINSGATSTSNNKLKPKSVLLNYISEIEKNNLDEENIKDLLKQLYEIIQYSIPDVNYVKSPENYEKLCETLSSISKDNKTTELEGLIFLAKKI